MVFISSVFSVPSVVKNLEVETKTSHHRGQGGHRGFCVGISWIKYWS